jgi:hypothetical protein
MKKFTLAIVVAIALCTASAFATSFTDLPVPTGLTSSVNAGDVTLQWNYYDAFGPYCTKNQQIQIFRNDVELSAIGGANTTYSDEGLAAGTYAYKIRARCQLPPKPRVAEEVHFSNFADAVTAQVTSVPACVGPPTVEAAASPTTLWPPNAKLVEVTVSGTVKLQPYCSYPDTISWEVLDEYDEVTPYGTAVLQANGSFSFKVNLEASRNDTDTNGRLYTIHIVADSGGPGSTDVSVTVPHDNRK